MLASATSRSGVNLLLLRQSLIASLVASTGSLRKPRGIRIEDAKLVLSFLPVPQRIPLLCELTSGTNIGTVLSWKWGQLDLTQTPMRIDYPGRKTNKKPYFALYSTETVQYLRFWKEEWKARMGRTPTDDDYVFLFKSGRFIDRGRLNRQMKATAQKLRNAGLVTSDPSRFTSHALRACFKTEACREEVNMPGIVSEFLMGHSTGMSGLYANTDEVRPEDICRACMRLEPYLSLSSHPVETNTSQAHLEQNKEAPGEEKKGMPPAGVL